MTDCDDSFEVVCLILLLYGRCCCYFLLLLLGVRRLFVLYCFYIGAVVGG